MVAEAAMNNMMETERSAAESEREEDPLMNHHKIVIAKAVDLWREQGQGGGKPIHP